MFPFVSMFFDITESKILLHRCPVFEIWNKTLISGPSKVVTKIILLERVTRTFMVISHIDFKSELSGSLSNDHLLREESMKFGLIMLIALLVKTYLVCEIRPRGRCKLDSWKA